MGGIGGWAMGGRKKKKKKGWGTSPWKKSIWGGGKGGGL